MALSSSGAAVLEYVSRAEAELKAKGSLAGSTADVLPTPESHEGARLKADGKRIVRDV